MDAMCTAVNAYREFVSRLDLKHGLEDFSGPRHTTKRRTCTYPSDTAIEREAADGEDGADLNDDEPQQEKLHLPPPHGRLFAVAQEYQAGGDEYPNPAQQYRPQVREVPVIAAEGDAVQVADAVALL